MAKIGTKERVAWLALAVLRGIERREGIIKKRAAVKALVERLGVTERQGRNILHYLIREQLLVPQAEGLTVSSFRVTAKGHMVLERLGI